MIKKLPLLLAACTLLAGNALADQLTIYKVNVNNDSGSDVYLTTASEASGCKVFWPDSKLPPTKGTIPSIAPFKLECYGNLPIALTLSFITQPTQSQGQTCWTTYHTSQFIDPITNISVSHFISQYQCGSSITPPPVLPNNPAPPTN